MLSAVESRQYSKIFSPPPFSFLTLPQRLLKFKLLINMITFLSQTGVIPMRYLTCLLLSLLYLPLQTSLAQIEFSDEIPITAQTLGANTVFSVDLDGDGDFDVLCSSHSDDKISWYENIDGNGTFGLQQIIATDAISVECVTGVDLDGDGDYDVLSSSSSDEKIAWYENIDGNGTFGPEQNVSTEASGARSVYGVDLDGDGDNDVLSAHGDNKIAWYENTDGSGNFGPQQIITTHVNNPKCVFSIDLDGDGDNDVLSAANSDVRIAWYENIDGQGTFGPQQIITVYALGAESVYSADLDGDGDNDVLSASWYDDEIAWYENIDGQGTFGPQQIISNNANSAESVLSADLDGDGDNDVLSASSYDGKITWYENTDGQGNFVLYQNISTQAGGAQSVFSADLDGDGDYDVLSASTSSGKIAWYENIDEQGNFGPEQLLSANTQGLRSIFSADLDGDGDRDMLSASYLDKRIAWYENIDGQGNFGVMQTITTDANNASSVFSADLDGDGDYDVLSASEYGDNLVWYENRDGQGTFGPQMTISAEMNHAIDILSIDLDGDGDYDVLAASSEPDKIAWYENTDGQGSFGPQQVITTETDGCHRIYSIDLDGDGDNDVLSASSADDMVAWYENTDGLGSFGPQRIITTDADWACSVHSVDLDGDGDNDVLSASYYDDKIAWYENTDGQGNFGPQLIITTNANEARSVFSADLDGDGDNDVLSANYDGEITWYENTDGFGSFGQQQIITSEAWGAIEVISDDLDGDGDCDVISGSFWDASVTDKIIWYRNDGPLGIGDAKSGTVLPSQFDLSIHPNPFNPTTVISFNLPAASFVKLSVYDIAGRLVTDDQRPTTNDFFQPGHHSITFDGTGLPSGIYFAKLQGGNLAQVKKMVLLE